MGERWTKCFRGKSEERVCVCVCVCVCVRWTKCFRGKSEERGYMSKNERAWACERERVCVYVCV